MKKKEYKEYKKPTIREAKLNVCRIICMSDGIEKGDLNDDDETPTPGEDGTIFVE